MNVGEQHGGSRRWEERGRERGATARDAHHGKWGGRGRRRWTAAATKSRSGASVGRGEEEDRGDDSQRFGTIPWTETELGTRRRGWSASIRLGALQSSATSTASSGDAVAMEGTEEGGETGRKSTGREQCDSWGCSPSLHAAGDAAQWRGSRRPLAPGGCGRARPVATGRKTVV